MFTIIDDDARSMRKQLSP